MFKYKGNEFVKFIINEMINEDFLEFHECSVRLAFYPDDYFAGNEPELILENYLKGNELVIRTLLSKSQYLGAEEINSIIECLFTIDEEEVITFYYAEGCLNEMQKLLLSLYEKYMLSTPETKVQLEKFQKYACEIIVNGLRYRVNDNSLRFMSEKILNAMKEKISEKDKYYNCRKYADMIS